MTAPSEPHVSSLTSPPRPVTSTVRRRAWGDPIVRAWWLLSVVLFLNGVGLIVAQLVAWRHQAWLIRSGTVVTAIAAEVDNERFHAGEQGKGRPKPPNSSVVLEFDWKGAKREVRGFLEGRTDFIYVGETVSIRVDPSNPDDWTARTDAPPLLVELIGGSIVIAVSVPLLLVSLLLRGRVLNAWRDGILLDTPVVKVGQSPLAPLCRAVQIADPSGKIQTVYIPARQWTGAEAVQVLQTGEGRPIAVALYLP